MEDPAVRADGKCALRGCNKRRPKLAGDDPFHSTECCRKYHKVKMSGDVPAPRRNSR